MSDRYARQTILPEVGEEGQVRLREACVLVVGAGGLGSAVLQYLCAAGVGSLLIVDPDRVEESNLHRQPIYRVGDVGRLKAQVAREALLSLNPQVEIEAACERLTPSNVARLVAAADLVVDAADSFAVTYVVSDECHRAHKVLVSASVLGLSGYIGAFCGGAPSYRAVFPDVPSQAGSCAQSGVLGTAVGVMGTLQAHIVLALINKLRAANDDLFAGGQFGHCTATTRLLVQELLVDSDEPGVREAEAAIERLAAVQILDGLAIQEVTLLELRALLARAKGDEVAYRQLADRYRAMATSLGFEGHIEWAEAMP